MGEAMIARGSTSRKNPLDDVNVIAGYCSILVKVTDSTGASIPNLPVWCKDGSTNYNYNTNAEGYTLFQCNSGAANITAKNFSILDKYTILDQTEMSANYDAPVGTKKIINIKLKSIDTNITVAGSCNGKFLSHNKANRIVTIGGGAAGLTNGCGGGGGAYNEITNVALDRSIGYKIIIGNGGARTTISSNAGGAAGGTTSAFGISSVGGSSTTGGGSGNYKGGDGHNTSLSWNWQQFPTPLVSKYYKENNSDPFKNFGSGGGRRGWGDDYSYNAPSWRGYTNIIALGGDVYTVTDRLDRTRWIGTQASTGPRYGCGGGGASIIGWVNYMIDNSQGFAEWRNTFSGGYAGAGAGGCVLINF